MKIETRKYRLTGLEMMLGSNPSDPQVRKAYIESKRPIEAPSEDESANTPEIDEDKGLTVFLLHPQTGGPMVYDYTIRGFFKDVINTLASQTGVLAAKSKVDKYLFVSPRHIPLKHASGERVSTTDGVYERSLRAMTAQGPRVTLAGSEFVKDWMIEIEVSLLENKETAKGKPITWSVIEDALDYGRLSGLGQWRNGGFGKFSWQRIDEESVK